MGYDLDIIGADDLPQEDVYLRVGMMTMARLRCIMAEFGMLATSYDHDDLPTGRFYDDFLEGRKARRAAGLPVSDDEDGEWWQSEENRALNHWRPTYPDPISAEEKPQWGIALHKLCSNSFWRVEAEECREALNAWVAASRQASSTGRKPSESELRDLLADRASQAEVAALEILAANPIGLLLGGGLREAGPKAAGEEFVDFWFDWLAFLARGARWDGFEVH